MRKPIAVLLSTLLVTLLIIHNEILQPWDANFVTLTRTPLSMSSMQLIKHQTQVNSFLINFNVRIHEEMANHHSNAIFRNKKGADTK